MKLNSVASAIFLALVLAVQLVSAQWFIVQGAEWWGVLLAGVSLLTLFVPILMILGVVGSVRRWHYTAEKLPPLGVRVIGLCGDDAEVLHLGDDDQLPDTYKKWCTEDGDPLDHPPSHWTLFAQNLPPLPTLVRP